MTGCPANTRKAIDGNVARVTPAHPVTDGRSLSKQRGGGGALGAGPSARRQSDRASPRVVGGSGYVPFGCGMLAGWSRIIPASPSPDCGRITPVRSSMVRVDLENAPPGHASRIVKRAAVSPAW